MQNVRCINEEEATNQLIKDIEKYNYNILTIQEIKRKENIMSEINNYILVNSDGINRMLGTRFNQNI